MNRGTSLPTAIDLEGLGFESGAQLLIRRALKGQPPGTKLSLRGRAPDLRLHLGAWCRQHGHAVEYLDSPLPGETLAVITNGSAEASRWSGAQRAGGPAPGETVDAPSATWGLAARGSLVEAGGADSGFDLDQKGQVWTDLAPRL